MSISENKLINMIVYFVFRSPNHKVNRLKLMKLLWLADRLHLNKYGRLISGNSYHALPHGPVPSEALDMSRKAISDKFEVHGKTISTNKDFNSDYFSNSDKEIMHEVWEKYNAYNSAKLKNMSHKFPEWLRYKKELNDINFPNSYKIIIDDFFSAPDKDVNYSHNPKLSETSKRRFYTHNFIQSILNE